LLELLLDYRAKTRTVDAYISALLDAFSLQIFSAMSPCQIALLSPIFGSRHKGRLAKAIHGFLTPTQIIEVARCLLKALVDSKAAADERRGCCGEAGLTRTSSEGIGPQATCHVLLIEICAVILSSFALSTLPETGREDVKGVVRDIINLVKLEPGKPRKWTREQEVICAVHLRLVYALGTARNLEIGAVLWNGPGEIDNLMALSKDVARGELKLEIVRHICFLLFTLIMALVSYTSSSTLNYGSQCRGYPGLGQPAVVYRAAPPFLDNLVRPFMPGHQRRTYSTCIILAFA
jgi:hypothetical protein